MDSQDENNLKITKKTVEKYYYTTIITITAIAVIIFLSVKLVKSFMRTNEMIAISENYSECYSSMAKIDDAISRYSKANKGKYPESLAQLVPKYLKEIPICPNAQKDTYSESYKVIKSPAMYFFCCQGKNHIGKENTPQIVSDLSFYTKKEENPVMYVYENGNMTSIMDSISEITSDLKKEKYYEAIEKIDQLLKIQVQRKDYLFVNKAYCLFKLKKDEEAINSLKKALEIDFRAEDWKKITPFAEKLENRWKVSDILNSYISSRKENLQAIIFLAQINKDSQDLAFWENICKKGLESAQEQTDSLFPEFYFRGKLALIEGNKDRARYFFKAVTEKSSGVDFVDYVSSSLCSEELDRLKKDFI